MTGWYWTPARLERLRELYAQGRTARELVEQFPGASPAAIRKAASRAGIRWGGYSRAHRPALDGARVRELDERGNA